LHRKRSQKEVREREGHNRFHKDLTSWMAKSPPFLLYISRARNQQKRTHGLPIFK